MILKLLYVIYEIFLHGETSVVSQSYGAHDHGMTLNFIIKYVLIGKFDHVTYEHNLSI